MISVDKLVTGRRWSSNLVVESSSMVVGDWLATIIGGGVRNCSTKFPKLWVVDKLANSYTNKIGLGVKKIEMRIRLVGINLISVYSYDVLTSNNKLW